MEFTHKIYGCISLLFKWTSSLPVIICIDSLISDSIYVNNYFNDDYILESKLWVKKWLV